MTHRPIRIAAALLLAAACSRAVADLPRTGSIDRARGVPGFDTALYPGDSTMRLWRTSSPYRWVGYYLPSPCHREASWAGTRGRLEAMGWGTAVIYVGQQLWEGAPDRSPSDTGAIICSRTLLGAEQGTREADDAIARTRADGFARGTVIYLDIEPMTAIAPAMRDYYRAWIARVLAEGTFRPGVYVHRRNAGEVVADLRAAYEARGAAGTTLPVWLAAPDTGFALDAAPSEAGLGPIRVWQGRVNATETWGGRALLIDANVADRPSPSAP